MKAHGNGRLETCATNLLRIVRGEVPYDRVKGRNGALVDQPNVTDDAVADAEWVLTTYEPRVTVEAAESIALDAANGDFSTVVTIGRKEEDADE